jgi:hypothetical protein
MSERLISSQKEEEIRWNGQIVPNAREAIPTKTERQKGSPVGNAEFVTTSIPD